MLNKQSWTANEGWSSSLGVWWWLTSPHHKILAYYEMLKRVLDLQGFCEHGNEHSGSIKSGKFLD